eukprot:778634_1
MLYCICCCYLCHPLGVVMDEEETSNADKLGLLFTLLLTGVALQFVVQTWLPSFAIDKYILLSFGIIFSVIITVFIVDIAEIELNDAKFVISWIFIVMFIVIHLCFVGYLYSKRKV